MYVLKHIGIYKVKEGCNKVIEIELEFLIDGFNNKDYFQRGFEFKCNKKETLLRYYRFIKTKDLENTF